MADAGIPPPAAGRSVRFAGGAEASRVSGDGPAAKSAAGPAASRSGKGPDTAVPSSTKPSVGPGSSSLIQVQGGEVLSDAGVSDSEKARITDILQALLRSQDQKRVVGTVGSAGAVIPATLAPRVLTGARSTVPIAGLRGQRPPPVPVQPLVYAVPQRRWRRDARRPGAGQLGSKAAARKRRRALATREAARGRVAAYCIADGVAVDRVAKTLRRWGRQAGLRVLAPSTRNSSSAAAAAAAAATDADAEPAIVTLLPPATVVSVERRLRSDSASRRRHDASGLRYRGGRGDGDGDGTDGGGRSGGAGIGPEGGPGHGLHPGAKGGWAGRTEPLASIPWRWQEHADVLHLFLDPEEAASETAAVDPALDPEAALEERRAIARDVVRGIDLTTHRVRIELGLRQLADPAASKHKSSLKPTSAFVHTSVGAAGRGHGGVVPRMGSLAGTAPAAADDDDDDEEDEEEDDEDEDEDDEDIASFVHRDLDRFHAFSTGPSSHAANSSGGGGGVYGQQSKWGAWGYGSGGSGGLKQARPAAAARPGFVRPVRTGPSPFAALMRPRAPGDAAPSGAQRHGVDGRGEDAPLLTSSGGEGAVRPSDMWLMPAGSQPRGGAPPPSSARSAAAAAAGLTTPEYTGRNTAMALVHAAGQNGAEMLPPSAGTAAPASPSQDPISLTPSAAGVAGTAPAAAAAGVAGGYINREGSWVLVDDRGRAVSTVAQHSRAGGSDATGAAAHSSGGPPLRLSDGMRSRSVPTSLSAHGDTPNRSRWGQEPSMAVRRGGSLQQRSSASSRSSSASPGPHGDDMAGDAMGAASARRGSLRKQGSRRDDAESDHSTDSDRGGAVSSRRRPRRGASSSGHSSRRQARSRAEARRGGRGSQAQHHPTHRGGRDSTSARSGEGDARGDDVSSGSEGGRHAIADRQEEGAGSIASGSLSPAARTHRSATSADHGDGVSRSRAGGSGGGATERRSVSAGAAWVRYASADSGAEGEVDSMWERDGRRSAHRGRNPDSGRADGGATDTTASETEIEGGRAGSERRSAGQGSAMNGHGDVDHGAVTDGQSDAERMVVVHGSSPAGPVSLAGARRRDVFVFPYGCVVLWGFRSEAEERSVLDRLAPFLIGALPEGEFDDMTYLQGHNSPSTITALGSPMSGGSRRRERGDDGGVSKSRVIGGDEVRLATTSPLERLAVSSAFAQSVKLSVIEERVSAKIEDTRDIPKQLATTGLIRLSTTEVSKRIGELFIERSSVNLTSDLLDTPEFLWDHDEYQDVYDGVQEYLDISQRVEVLNRRLDVMHELLNILMAQQESQHAQYLEWIVIWLILIEVVLEVVGILIEVILFEKASS